MIALVGFAAMAAEGSQERMDGIDVVAGVPLVVDCLWKAIRQNYFEQGRRIPQHGPESWLEQVDFVSGCLLTCELQSQHCPSKEKACISSRSRNQAHWTIGVYGNLWTTD